MRAFLAGIGAPAYRAKQVVRHLWQSPAASFEDMTDLPAAGREELVDILLARAFIDDAGAEGETAVDHRVGEEGVEQFRGAEALVELARH